MFKKKSKNGDKAKEPAEMKIQLDSLEMESVAEQLREIEKKKPKEKNKG